MGLSKKEIGKDFTTKLNNEFYENLAESHIEVWENRYKEYKNKKEVEFDLKVNHDSTLEIERVEEELGRKLTTDEMDKLVSKFNKTVLNKINLQKLRHS